MNWKIVALVVTAPGVRVRVRTDWPDVSLLCGEEIV